MEFPFSSILDCCCASLLFLSGNVCCWDPQLILNAEISYSAGMIIASFTFYISQINISNGFYIITLKSDVQKVFVFTVCVNTYLNCFEFQNIIMI